jgi:hypothetical protein
MALEITFELDGGGLEQFRALLGADAGGRRAITLFGI